ncbi:MAG: hypothetical protein ACE5FW_00340 [Candidatus Aenigmatarchaeota archaeon]
MARYIIITGSISDVSEYCDSIFERPSKEGYLSGVRFEFFKTRMEERFGFVPGIELSAPDFKGLEGMRFERLLIIDGEFIYHG